MLDNAEAILRFQKHRARLILRRVPCRVWSELSEHEREYWTHPSMSYWRQ